MKKKLIGINW